MPRHALSLLLLLTLQPAACAASLPPPPTAEAGVLLDAPLEPLGRIGHGPLDELSGLVAASDASGTFWAHNDSGASPNLFALALTDDGAEVLVPDSAAMRYAGGTTMVRRAWPGIEITGADNVDWEDIARIDDVLYVADIGNNRNARRDLGFWVVPEPAPEAVHAARAERFLPVHYPEQEGFPGEVREWDSEAVFADAGHLYLLTKHRQPTGFDQFAPGTRLYRLDPNRARQGSVPLELVDRNEAVSVVTAADLSPDGELLAVLTYSSIWLFPRPASGDAWLSGRPWIRRLPMLRTRQAEALAWRDDDRIVIGNEDGMLFELRLDRAALAGG